jgi:hypothetical protein
MSRKAIGEKAMTAAERQRRRRAKLRGDSPPPKRGRPRLKHLESDGDTAGLRSSLWEMLGHRPGSLRSHDVARRYRNFGEQVLGIDSKAPSYSHENAERYRPLSRKPSILEQLGRHAVFMMREGWVLSLEEAMADAREHADELLEFGDDLNVKAMVEFFQDLRVNGPWTKETEAASTSESDG